MRQILKIWLVDLLNVETPANFQCTIKSKHINLNLKKKPQTADLLFLSCICF